MGGRLTRTWEWWWKERSSSVWPKHCLIWQATGCILKRKYLAFVAIILKCCHGLVGWITELFSLVGLSLNLDHCNFFCLYNIYINKDCLSELQVNSSWIAGELRILYPVPGVHWLQLVHLNSTWSPSGVHQNLVWWYGCTTTKKKLTWTPGELRWTT